MKLPYDGVAVYEHENLGNRLVEMDVQLLNGDWVGIQMRQAILFWTPSSRTATCSGSVRPWCSYIKTRAVSGT